MKRKQNTKVSKIVKEEKTRELKLREKGITLIALIITIIVLIVLAVVSINAIFGAEGLIAQARRTDLIVEFTIYLEEKKNYDSEKKYEDSDYNEESLNAGRTTLAYNTQESTGGNIQTVIPSMDDEYAGMFEIIKGEFYLYATSELEREVATELGIEVSPYLIDNGVLLSANANLGLQTENGVVTLPERVTEIGEGAFSGVEGLKEVIIPGTVKVIQKNAFSFNTEIEKVTIQDGVLSIGEKAFAYCTSLKEIVMPDSVVSMGNETFRGCSNLTTAKLSNNLTNLSEWQFGNCGNLTTINIPTNITYIGSNEFYYCNKLDNLQIPASCTSIDSSAFLNCTNLYNLTIDEANPIYEVEDGIIYRKDNSSLIMLAPMATKEEVTIREGIKSLGAAALSMCKSMITLNLPSSLSSIRGSTFESLTLLEKINFPNGNNTYMAEDGYLYTNGGKTLVYVVPTKTTINIKETVETIGNNAINGPKVIEVIIPDNVTTINGSIFRSTTKLKKIEIGSGLKTLSPNFKAWAGIPSGLELTIDEDNPYYKVEGNLILTKNGEEVVTYINRAQSQIIPEGVVKLQSNSFVDFNSATEIKLPSTLKEIGNSAFSYCTSLIEIQIPNNVETIGSSAFGYCGKLETINIDKEKDSISGSPWNAPKGERAIIWLR